MNRYADYRCTLSSRLPPLLFQFPFPFQLGFHNIDPDSMQIGKVAFNQQLLLQHPDSLKRICLCHNKIYLTLHDALCYCSDPNSSSS